MELGPSNNLFNIRAPYGQLSLQRLGRIYFLPVHEHVSTIDAGCMNEIIGLREKLRKVL